MFADWCGRITYGAICEMVQIELKHQGKWQGAQAV